MNYYELFDLPVSPVVNKQLIAKKYFALQKENHPDFFTNELEVDKENALEQSANINKAFNIFSNSEKTIEYFLQLKGIILADEKYNLPPGFLMEMMELNEAIDEKTDVAEQIVALEKKLLDEIAPLLLPENAVLLDEKALLQLKEYYYKKKYLKRILERLND